MTKRNITIRRGFTHVEMAITIIVSVIAIVGISVMLVDSQRGWNKMYNRAHGDVVTDGYVARKMFDAVIRKANRERIVLGDDGDWVEIYYYADSDSTVVDCYARFFVSGGDLNIEYGQLNPGTTLSIDTVCQNVSDCTFKSVGRSAQMILTLDDGSQSLTTVSSAVMHN